MEVRNKDNKLVSTEAEPLKRLVNYKLRWLDNDGDLLKTFESDVPFSLQLPNRSLPSRDEAAKIKTETILEIEQTVKGPHSSMETFGYAIRRELVDDIVIGELQPTKIIIHSKLLIGAISDTVPYYPSQALNGETITITEPFAVLMHYLDDLEDLHRKESERAPTDGNGAAMNKDSLAYHLEVLLDFLEPYVSSTLEPIKKRLELSEPVVTFDTMWYLFRPGIDVYYNSSISNMTHAYVMTVLRPETDEEAAKHHQKPGWIVAGFNLESDGVRITRNEDDGNMRIPHFEGEQEVTSLKVFPCEYWDRKDGGSRRRDYIVAGKKIVQLLRRRKAFMRYSGNPLSRRRMTVIT